MTGEKYGLEFHIYPAEPGISIVFPEDCSEMFADMWELRSVEAGDADLSHVTNMDRMFAYDSGLRTPIDIPASVRTADGMYAECDSLCGDVEINGQPDGQEPDTETLKQLYEEKFNVFGRYGHAHVNLVGTNPHLDLIKELSENRYISVNGKFLITVCRCDSDSKREDLERIAVDKDIPIAQQIDIHDAKWQSPFPGITSWKFAYGVKTLYEDKAVRDEYITAVFPVADPAYILNADSFRSSLGDGKDIQSVVFTDREQSNPGEYLCADDGSVRAAVKDGVLTVYPSGGSHVILFPENCSEMFRYAENISIDFGNIDASRTKNIGSMFYGSKLKKAPDLHPFTNVQDVSFLFYDCYDLEEAPDLSFMTQVNTIRSLFDGCYHLKTYTGSQEAEGSFAGYVLPSHAGNAWAAFKNCREMVTAPVLPASITRAIETFQGCSSLRGRLAVNFSLGSYELGSFLDGCAAGPDTAIDLYGTGEYPYSNRSTLLNCCKRYVSIHGDICVSAYMPGTDIRIAYEERFVSGTGLQNNSRFKMENWIGDYPNMTGWVIRGTDTPVPDILTEDTDVEPRLDPAKEDGTSELETDMLDYLFCEYFEDAEHIVFCDGEPAAELKNEIGMSSDRRARAAYCEADRTVYIWRIGTNGKVTLPENSSYAFAYLRGIKTIDFTNADMSKLKKAVRMFAEAEDLEKVIGLDQAVNLTSLSEAFAECGNLQTAPDISGMTGLKDTSEAFLNCINLVTYDGSQAEAGDFTGYAIPAGVEKKTDMFSGCSRITGLPEGFAGNGD